MPATASLVTLTLSCMAHRWSSTEVPTVLAVYCVYVLVLAANGLTEALVFAVAGRRQLLYLNKVMAALFVAYAAAAMGLLRALGTSGIVVASALHMAGRVVTSWSYLTRFFNRRGLSLDVLKVRIAWRLRVALPWWQPHPAC